MKTLELFNCVLAKKGPNEVYVSEDGYVVTPSALWAKDKIVEFYRQKKLSGFELNQTFYKSFQSVLSKTRLELAWDQIRHYFSTYGTNFTGDVYIPDEVLQVPDLKLQFKVITGCTRDEIVEKCLRMLSSGVALKEETIDMILSVLTDEMKYEFTGNENIRNKEAIVKIADLFGVYPKDTMEFLRYCVYRSTDSTLLIKNYATIMAIKSSPFNPGVLFKQHGLEKLAEIFNRFKPIFLAYKKHCPVVINQISKLSKTMHKPLVQNPLNSVTSRLLVESDEHWLHNATPYAIFKALQAISSRVQGQVNFNYRIRNGKSWSVQRISNQNSVLVNNYLYLLGYLKRNFKLKNKKIYIPKGVFYALPTSEKMFVENIPTGTQFSGMSIVGIYWKGEWGARDIDLSAVSLTGKVGWNSRYVSDDGEIVYSGDMTYANPEAAEYLSFSKGLKESYIVYANIFSGDVESGYKIILGKGENVKNRDHIMNPNNVVFETKTTSIQHSNVLGFLSPGDDGPRFTLLNFGNGGDRVSKYESTRLSALYEQYKSPMQLERVLNLLDVELVDSPDKADLDLSIDKLNRDTFTDLFVRAT